MKTCVRPKSVILRLTTVWGAEESVFRFFAPRYIGGLRMTKLAEVGMRVR